MVATNFMVFAEIDREREMTGLVHESPVSSLVLPVLMRPILSGLERQDQGASQTLRAAFSKVHCNQIVDSCP